MLGQINNAGFRCEGLQATGYRLQTTGLHT